MAKQFVDQTLTELRLKDNKLINVLPVGGWENVIKLYKDLVSNNYFGPSTLLFCVLDGDVLSIDQYKKYRKDSTPKFFLPIPSVEKLLQQIPLNPQYVKLRSKLNSHIFTTSTIENLYTDFYRVEDGLGVDTDPDGKNFYNHLTKHLGKRGINEAVFVASLCSFVNESVDSSQFKENIKQFFESALG